MSIIDLNSEEVSFIFGGVEYPYDPYDPYGLGYSIKPGPSMKETARYLIVGAASITRT